MSIYVPARTTPPPPQKAGPLGPGAGVLQTEFPLTYYGKQSPQKKMKRAWDLSFEVPWIAAAEDAIIERFSGVDWHLEDEQDTEIDDTYPNADAQAARQLIEKPAANLPERDPYYQADLWALTARAMGVCGSAFIFLDSPEALANTPSAMLPIAPWRFTGDEDPQGNLLGWYIDRTQSEAGIRVRLDQVLHFRLRRAFEGHFGVGLVESAMAKAHISTGLDKHVGMVLDAGGKLSGILSPKTGVITENETMLQLERDWRTATESADAAKRLQLVRAPIQFDRTTLTPQELQIRDMLNGARDDLLGIWGVPLSIIGGTTPAGLNSGDTRKYDEAAIWQGPVHHRLNVFRGVMQYQLLDRWQGLGVTVELEIDEPEFDDDSPRYDLLFKSAATPLTNSERRGLIGFPPLGDPALDNAIVLPATSVPYAMAPGEEPVTSTAVVLGRAPQAQIGPPAETPTAATPPAKASKVIVHPRMAPLHRSMTRLRTNIDAKMTPRIRSAVQAFLVEQRKDIASRLRRNASHVAAHPSDTKLWFPETWDRKLAQTLASHLAGVAETVSGHIGTVLPAKAAPVGAVERVLERGAARVTKINETTRDRIKELIADGLDAGSTVLDVADGLETEAIFDEYRAELIARTELMDAYNASAIGSYQDAGINEVQAIDGDGDEECAARDGEIFSVEEADAIEDHPNGTLDWVPVMEAEKAEPVHVEVHGPALPDPPKRMVFERDPETGKLIGIREEPL